MRCINFILLDWREQSRSEVSTWWRCRCAFHGDLRAQKASRREGDIVQADVALFTATYLALKHHLEISVMAKWDLPHLPVVPLISCQLQQEIQMSIKFDEHAQRSDAISRHMNKEAHLNKKDKSFCKCFKKICVYLNHTNTIFFCHGLLIAGLQFLITDFRGKRKSNLSFIHSVGHRIDWFFSHLLFHFNWLTDQVRGKTDRHYSAGHTILVHMVSSGFVLYKSFFCRYKPENVSDIH